MTCVPTFTTRPAERPHPHLRGRADSWRRRGPDGEKDDAGNAQMPSKNERVELGMKIILPLAGGLDRGRGVSTAHQQSTRGTWAEAPGDRRV